VEEVCRRLGIGKSVAYEAAELISQRLTAPGKSAAKDGTEHAHCERALRDRDFEIAVIRYQLDHPGSREAGIRIQFDPSYKAHVEACRAQYGVTIERASQILHIPIDTLKKFHRAVNDAATLTPSADDDETLPAFVVELVNEYLRNGRGAKSVKTFCQRNPELLKRLEMSYRQVLGWLKRLGFVSPRGIFLKNKGLDKIIRFRPNQVWGSDGKRMVVILNGEVFEWTWQCLVDGKTTVIVGGVINREENTENLLTAIQESKHRTGITPMAIVLDNRLSEDLPAIRSYLDEMGIEIIKIFPGNSKSNGITEGNFNIFDRWVGPVEIKGATPEELSRSIANVLVEIFTQMRNHKPRPGLSLKSAQEVADEAVHVTPEEEADTRAKLKAMADRLNQEQARPEISEQKRLAIKQAAQVTNHPHPDVLENRLRPSCYRPDLILQAIAIFNRQTNLFPEKRFTYHYFGGILRNLVDQQSVEILNTQLNDVYAHHWATLDRLTEEERGASLRSHPIETCTRLAADFMAMPVPAFSCRILLDLKESFLITSKGCAAIASSVRKSIADFILGSKKAAVSQREILLRKLFEWENLVRLCDRASEGMPVGQCGHA
jgi:hypothetical protein